MLTTFVRQGLSHPFNQYLLRASSFLATALGMHRTGKISVLIALINTGKEKHNRMCALVNCGVVEGEK